MKIIIRQNSVSLKNVELGKGFSDIRADLRVDQRGRVKVYIGSTSFYTDLNHLPTEILEASYEILAGNKLANIETRIKTVLDARNIESSLNDE